MLLHIEKWIAEIPLPKESVVAFQEAAIAYKAGANRAALLFSYLAWGLTLRDRILKAPGAPTGVTQEHWEAILRRLRDDDRWDAQVFDCTQMQSPAPLFTVSDDLRVQVRYWRDRRNDCAHFKLNEIDAPHVEAFWAFIRSNLGRFVPRGSEAELTDALLRYFDANVTAPGTDLIPLVKRIPGSMTRDRFKPFILNAREALTTSWGTVTLPRSDEFNFFLATCLSEGGLLGEAALEVLLEDRAALVGTLRIWPQTAGYMSGHPEHIRELWRKDLFKKGHTDLRIYASLLRNSLIPPEQLEEANDRAVKGISGDVPDSGDVAVLDAAGFFAAFRALAFEQRYVNQFAWGNANAPMVTWYLEHFPLDETVARAICESFGAPPYPFAAETALRELFSGNSRKYAELCTMAQQIGCAVPTGWTAATAN